MKLAWKKDGANDVRAAGDGCVYYVGKAVEGPRTDKWIADCVSPNSANIVWRHRALTRPAACKACEDYENEGRERTKRIRKRLGGAPWLQM
jgi:hypothetical protein